MSGTLSKPTKMKDGQLVQDHLRHMKKISDELAALESVVAEEEQVVALLISLPPSYTTLVTALEAKGDDLNLKFVQQALINEEQKRLVVKEAMATGSRYSDSVLQMDKETPRPLKTFKGRCYSCNKEGHKASECRKKVPAKSNKIF